MSRTSIIAPLCLVGVFVLLSADRIQANIGVHGKHGKHVTDSKLYDERRGSKIEDWFRNLPTVENEVNGLFEDSSFLSSFGPATRAVKSPEEEIQALFRRILSAEESGRQLRKGFKTVPKTEASSTENTGRADIQIPNDGQYTFSNFQPLNFAPVGNEGTTSMGPFESTNSMGFQEVENADTVDYLNGSHQPSAPISLSNMGQFYFNFPTIQHVVYSGPIRIKAQSSMDLSTMDPEIFDVVQSILTPFLQQTVGDSLISYNLEIDYAPGRSGMSDNVVTVMEVKCTFKVVSDSIESFLGTNHAAANKWLHDFFSGPARYNVEQLVQALKSNDIPVNDIVFVTENFDMGNTVSQANSQSFGTNLSSTALNNKNAPSGAAMVVITLSVLSACILLFMHYTGRLPSKAEIGEFSLNTRDKTINTLDSLKHRMPATFELLNRKRGRDNNEGGGRRRRTFSGTFRRFPTGGLKKAAIQKKPAKSQEYLGDSESTSAKLSAFEDYSFSKYGGDYAPSTPSRKSSVPPMTPMSRMSGDEFSMPSGYESVHERSNKSGHQQETLLGKFGNLMNSKRQKPEKSPVPTRAARRVTANDLASLDDVDNWSIDSYETDVKSPTDGKLYRGWKESGAKDSAPKARKEKLSLPYFK